MYSLCPIEHIVGTLILRKVFISKSRMGWCGSFIILLSIEIVWKSTTRICHTRKKSRKQSYLKIFMKKNYFRKIRLLHWSCWDSLQPLWNLERIKELAFGDFYHLFKSKYPIFYGYNDLKLQDYGGIYPTSKYF